MNRTKQLSIVLLTIAVVTSAVFGPGAFTSLTADRQADVDVVGDADAFIGLEPSNSSNGQYATFEDGELQLRLDESVQKGSGAGVNDGAKTTVEDVFTISNNGAGPVAIWLEHDQEGVTFERSDEDRPIESEDNAVALEPGDTIPISIVVDTLEHDLEDDLLEEVDVVADSDVSGIVGDGGSASGDSSGDDEKPWGEWDEEPEDPETKDEDEFFEPTEEEEDEDESLGEKAWGVVESTVDEITSFADDPRGYLEDKYEWAVDLTSSIVNGLETLIEDRSISGLVDILVDKLVDAGGEFISLIQEEADLKSFVAGFLVGEMGMPDGFLETNLNDSASYMFGYVTAALAPGWSFVSDTQSIIQNVANGELVEAAIDAVGFAMSIPSLGAGNPAKALGAAQSWAKHFGDKVGKGATATITKLVPELPQQLSVRIFDQFTDGKKASKLNDAGLSDKQIANLMENGKLKKVDAEEAQKLAKQDGVKSDHVELLIKNDADLEEARKLRNGRAQVPAEDIVYYAERDIPLKQISKLKKKVDPENIRTYSEAGYPPSHIEDMITNQKFRPSEVKNYHDRGYDLTEISIIRSKGAKVEDINRWTTNDIDIQNIREGVNKHKKSGDELSSNWDNAKGDLGETFGAPKIKNEYPPSEGYKHIQGVKFDSGATGEVDQVVVDKNGDIVAMYEVKASKSKSGKANNQMTTAKGNIENDNIGSIDSNEIDVEDLPENADNIEYYTMGPSDSNDFDKTFDYTEDEVEGMLDVLLPSDPHKR